MYSLGEIVPIIGDLRYIYTYSLAFVGGLVVDSRRLKFHGADPSYIAMCVAMSMLYVHIYKN